MKATMNIATSSIHSVRFPVRPKADMLRALGANGRVLSSGLSVMALAGCDVVLLNPINSLGSVSMTAALELPYHQKTLESVAFAFHDASTRAPTHRAKRAALVQPSPQAVPPGIHLVQNLAYPQYAPAVRWPTARGKYGRVKMRGVRLTTYGTESKIQMQPVNSRNELSTHCTLEVSFDRDTLQELADIFVGLAQSAP